jgi:uncharacterized delta-60 repeat protein
MPRRARLNVEPLETRITPVAGALDPSFSTDGIVTQDLTGYYQTGAQDVVVQADGKVVVAGTAKLLETSYPAVFRYNTDGSLDTTFGLNGVGVLTVPGGTGDFYSVALQADGKIVASGTGRIGGNYQALVARLNADGSPDASFGNDGITLVDASAGDDNGFAVAVQADGKIVAAGNAQLSPTEATYRTLILRLTTDGLLDPTFDSDGVALLTTGPIARAVMVQSDGKIVVAGEEERLLGLFTLARVNADGSPDATFGTSGWVKTSPAGTAFNKLHDAVLLPDGGILVAGVAGVGSGYRPTPILLKYTTAGALDSTFGTNGVVMTDLLGRGGEYQAVALQDDGKILAVGGHYGSGNSILARYATDGQLDTTFGAPGATALPGIATTDLAPSDGEGYFAVAVGPDGRIVAAGIAGGGSVQRLAVARYDSIDLPAVAAPDGYAVDRYATLTVAGPGVLANDARPGGAAITIVVTRWPDHGTLVLDQSGGFTYTPDADFVGTDSFQYRLDNGLASDPATVTLVVRPVAAPPITGVSSPAANGVYGVGTRIPITVRFAAPVTVTGDPTLALATGTGAVASFVGGSGTNTLTFAYTVAAGDNTTDLDYTSPFALALNGGTIRDGTGTDVPLTLADPGTPGSLGAAKGIAIETPVISLAAPAAPADESGETSLVYTFTRTGATTDPLTIVFYVSGSATFGTDYTQSGADSFGPATGTVTFPAGSSTATVSIDPLADGLFEYDESVVLSLTPPAGYVPPGAFRAFGAALVAPSAYAAAGSSAVTGGFANGTGAATLRLSGGTAEYDPSTGRTTFTFTVRLNQAVSGGFTVAYTTNNGSAVAGADYADNDGTLTFAGTAGETHTITVAVAGNRTGQPDETFSVALGELSGNTAPQLAAITKLGSPQTATIQNTGLNVTAVADLGRAGLWRVTPSGWIRLTTANVEGAAVSTDGRTVVADFGAGGLRRWTANAGWAVLSSSNAQQFAMSRDGRTVVADFGGAGLWRWVAIGGWTRLATGDAEAVRVSANGETVVADLGRAGLKRWTSGRWSVLTPANVEAVAASGDGRVVVADLGRSGLWRWAAGTGWVRLSTGNVEGFVLAADGATVVADFGPNGLRRWTTTGGWVVLASGNAERVVVSDDGATVVADFGAGGLRRRTPAGWAVLSPANVQNVAVSRDGRAVLADFGPGGLRGFDGRWVALSPVDPEGIWVG